MKITIELTANEKKHLKQNHFCEMDACNVVVDIIRKIRRQIK